MLSDVEVLIVSYDSAADIETCLASIARNAPAVSVAVREHGHDRGAREQLERLAAAHGETTRVEFDASNPGFGAGCNALARSSKAQWLVFLNPDTELLAWPWIDGHDPPRGCVVGATMRESGHPGDHAGVAYGVREEIARSWLRRRGPQPNGSGFVSGAAMLIDAESFRRVGGFDEAYFMYYEDIDFCLRANAVGIGTEVESNWIVRHARAHSTRSRFADALIWSYDSGCRFHSSQGSSLAAYRSYVVLDGLGRSVVHHARRDRHTAKAYRDLARRAAADLFGRRRVPDRRSRS